MNRQQVDTALLASLEDENNPFISTPDLLNRLEEKKKDQSFLIQQIPFSKLKEWHFDKDCSSLSHEKQAFFSVKGIELTVNHPSYTVYNQAIIDQPEVGILGLICKIFQGKMYFLMQFKFEPGNMHYFQLAPTFQATKSNYSRVHGGNLPQYANYFLEINNSSEVLYDQLQSEQASRFFQKRNRNLILLVHDEIPVLENFFWLSLKQLGDLLLMDNVVNMDSRSVLACLPLSFMHVNEVDHSEITDIRSWLRYLQSNTDYGIRFKALNELKDWVIDDFSIGDKDKKQFHVIALDVEIDSRENKKWTQPILAPYSKENNVFFRQFRNGVHRYLVQAKFEIGNPNFFELGPSIQAKDFENVPFVNLLRQTDHSQIKVLFSTWQSEEGGRFYLDENKYQLLELKEEIEFELPENYRWMTLAELHYFLRFSNYLNMQARTLLAIINLKTWNQSFV